MEKKIKIGILGGSFNPIHKAHLVLAKEARRQLKLDKVLFMPCYLAPHKNGKEVIAARHRLAMIRAVIRNVKTYVSSDLEIKRKGRSYTVDTLKQLKKKYPEGTEFYFILGSDSWNQIKTWKQPGQLSQFCRFVVFNRQGFPVKKYPDLPKPVVLKIKPVEISSTKVREKIKSGRSIKKEVPKEAAEYIEEKGLYA